VGGDPEPEVSSTSTNDSGTISTPQVEAPRTTEQLVAGATSAHEIGYGRRSARGHGYELRGLAYLLNASALMSRLHEGRFGRRFPGYPHSCRPMRGSPRLPR
jgi:hypothetical protein